MLLAMGIRANPIRFTLVPALALGAAGVAVAQYYGTIDPGVGWFIGINLGTYPTWWVDKRQAKRDGFRVPEWTLHLLSMVGGGPAAVVAMRTLRHKTSGPRLCREPRSASCCCSLGDLNVILAQGSPAHEPWSRGREQ